MLLIAFIIIKLYFLRFSMRFNKVVLLILSIFINSPVLIPSLEKRLAWSNREYKGKYLLGYRCVKKPDQLSWENWARIILNSFPRYLKEHYLGKINIFLKWWRKELYDDILHIHKENTNDVYDHDGIYI